jgi:hypothetical protein
VRPVLAKLRQLCDQRDPMQIPQISELMCELGDYGKIGVVASAYIAGKYGGATSLPDDSAAGSNAEDYALRQVILYGTDSLRNAIQRNAQRKDDPLSKERAFFTTLVAIANEDWKKLPKTYDRSHFPLRMLADALTDKREWSSAGQGSNHWTIRRCDEAASAIQKFTGKQFGYDETKSEAEKDEAVLRIQTWWKNQPTNERIQGKTEKGAGRD